jgi:hypothetical protein
VVEKWTEPVLLLGDVDDSGVVNIDDLTALIDCLLTEDESTVNKKNADCHPDDVLNIDDVTTLVDYLLTEVW